jgi:hypothetical protein
MDKYFEEKDSLHQLLASKIPCPRDGAVETIIDQVEKVLGTICGNQGCDETCQCQKEGENGLMMEIEAMTRDETKEEK